MKKLVKDKIKKDCFEEVQNMENIRKMLEELFTPNPLDPNVYDITLKEKVYEDGYFSIELINGKTFFRGLLQITLLDKNDQVFRKGLEQFIQNQEELNDIALKYINAYNKACSMHINPYLQEKNYTVEGDGEPEWIILYKKDMTEEFAKCEKNRDMIMVISDEVAKVGYNLVFRDIKEKYFGTKNQMLKEAKEKYIVEKGNALKKETGGQLNQPLNKAESPTVHTKAVIAAKPLQIKIFSNTDKKILEKEVNSWLAGNTNIELQFSSSVVDATVCKTMIRFHKG